MLSNNNSNYHVRGWHIAAFFGALALLLGIGLTAGGAFASMPTDMPQVAAAPKAVAPHVNPGGSDIVISQVYGGGGNSGAYWRNDFVELFNPTNASISFSGWSVQYASAALPFTGTNGVTTIAGTIAAGGYYLVQLSAGANALATPLPTPNAIGLTAMGATAGKIALVNNTTALTCGSNHTTNTCIGNPNVIDYVGYGATASDWEGSGPTIAPGNTASVVRHNNGCDDADNNAGDFGSATDPNIVPRNSQSPTYSCQGTSTPTPTSIPTCGTGGDYAIIPGSGVIDPATNDIGLHNSTGTAAVALPFAYSLYGVPYTTANVSVNGTLQFSSNSGAFTNSCLPTASFSNAILAYWDGLDTSLGITNTFAPGIYTSTSGTAPNRVFNIEWKACVFNTGQCNRDYVDVEIRMLELTSTFEVVYGHVEAAGDFATIGVQRGSGISYSQYSCNYPALSDGRKLTFRPYICVPPEQTFTPTPTGTPTIVGTATGTPTSTATHGPSNSVVISEFRTRGGNGATDEFIELYNKTGSPIDIGNWRIDGSSNCGTTISTRFTITSGIMLPAYGHFLAANSGYTGTVAPDITYTLGIADPGGIGLVNSSNVVLDAVGMCITTTHHEGAPLPTMSADAEQSYERLLGGLAGNAVDTNDNTNDFFYNSSLNNPLSSTNPQNLGSPPVPPCTPSTVQNSIQGFAFNPASMTIYQGDTVNWTNLDAAIHTSTSDAIGWDSGGLTQNGQFSFTFNTPGVYPYHCDIHPSMLGTITVLAGCAPLVTATPTATATPPTAILVGHVTWQQIPQGNPRSVLPITLTLKGGVEVNFPQQNTDASGFFTVSVAGLPNGTYNWRVMGPDGVSGGNVAAAFIANCGTVALAGAPQTDAEMGTMRGGDANNDNIVGATDFNILKTDFGQAGIRRGDFDNTLVVNTSDFNLLKGNFGQGGCGVVLSPGARSR